MKSSSNVVAEDHVMDESEADCGSSAIGHCDTSIFRFGFNSGPLHIQQRSSSAGYETPQQSNKNTSSNSNLDVIIASIMQDEQFEKQKNNLQEGQHDEKIKRIEEAKKKFPELFGQGIIEEEDENEICSICLELYTVDNPAIDCTCNHKFHLQCVEEWMQRYVSIYSKITLIFIYSIGVLIVPFVGNPYVILSWRRHHLHAYTHNHSHIDPTFIICRHDKQVKMAFQEEDQRVIR